MFCNCSIILYYFRSPYRLQLLSLQISHYWQNVRTWRHSLHGRTNNYNTFVQILIYLRCSKTLYSADLTQCLSVGGLFTAADRCHSVDYCFVEICLRDPWGEIWCSNLKFLLSKNVHGNCSDFPVNALCLIRESTEKSHTEIQMYSMGYHVHALFSMDWISEISLHFADFPTF